MGLNEENNEKCPVVIAHSAPGGKLLVDNYDKIGNTNESERAYLIVILDTSGSMAGAPIRQATINLNNLLKNNNIDQFTMITFDSHVRIVNYRNISFMEPTCGGCTNFSNALSKLDEITRITGQYDILIITDGEFSDIHRVPVSINTLQNNSKNIARITSIRYSTGGNIDTRELARLSSITPSSTISTIGIHDIIQWSPLNSNVWTCEEARLGKYPGDSLSNRVVSKYVWYDNPDNTVKPLIKINGKYAMIIDASENDINPMESILRPMAIQKLAAGDHVGFGALCDRMDQIIPPFLVQDQKRAIIADEPVRPVRQQLSRIMGKIERERQERKQNMSAGQRLRQ